MDFAPYQSSPPEHGRIASPDYVASPRASHDARRPFSPARNSGQYQNPSAARSPPPLQHPQPQRGWAGFDGQADHGGYQQGGGFGGGAGAGTGAGSGSLGAYPAVEVGEFDTSLGLRLDYEACLAYVGLPPLGAIFLLIRERNSDYVRFHAWQSALLFTTLMILHLILCWSSFLSWVLFIIDLGLIALLTTKAYRDAEILERFELPIFGRIANSFLDDE